MKNTSLREKGITLIALVITIIVLLILAGITIGMAKNIGLINKSKKSAQEYKIASAEEKLKLKISNLYMDKQQNEGRNLKLVDLFEWVDSNSKNYDEEIKSVTQIDDNNVKVEIDGYSFSIDNNMEVTYLENAGAQIFGNNIRTGLISDTEYKINNTTLKYKKIVIVGENEECKTIKEAFDYLYNNGYKDNGAILLRAGTYDTTDLYTGYSYNINSKYNKMTISIIADEPGKVFIPGGEMGVSENDSSYSIGLNFYRVVFKNIVSNEYFHVCMDSKENNYYNCVFLAPAGGWNGNYKNATANLYNCLIAGGQNELFYNDYPTKGKQINCASTNEKLLNKNGTETTCIKNVKYDTTTYQITSEGWEHTGTGNNPDGTQANIGVYGGEYAWPYLNTKVNKENKKIEIDASSYMQRIRKIKYMYGTTDENKIKNEGIELNLNNNKAEIINIKNGPYTIIITNENGTVAKSIIKIEGINTLSEYKINNTTLKYKRLVMVGANEESKTVKEAFDYLYSNGYKDNGAILLKAGTYDTKDLYTGYSLNINPKYNGMTISIIADEPGKVFIPGGEMGESEINSSYSIGLNFYRIVFKNIVSNDYFCICMDSQEKNYYNCVFLAPAGGWNGKYSESTANLYNCLIAGGQSGFYDSYPTKGKQINCASTNEKLLNRNGTESTCIKNVKYDSSTYQITSEGWEHTGTGSNPDGTQANIGVYGGEYAWTKNK